MPVPEGFITTSKIWTGEAEEVPLPEEPTEVEEKEEEREEWSSTTVKWAVTSTHKVTTRSQKNCTATVRETVGVYTRLVKGGT